MRRTRKTVLTMMLAALPFAASGCATDAFGGTLHFPIWVDGFVNRFNPLCAGTGVPFLVWCPYGESPTY